MGMDTNLAVADLGYRSRTACMHCGGGLDTVLDLGKIVVSDFPRPTTPDPLTMPLSLLWCDACHFVQLGQIVDDTTLYTEYLYRSGIIETMRAELADIVKTALAIVPEPKGVLDVGANDGTLLSHYPLGVHRIAVEPASNLFEAVARQAHVVLTGFFPTTTYYLPEKSVDICTTIAMFYDLEDPVSAVVEIDRLLTADGVWIVQLQDLAQQVATTAFDNVCFEHRGYYSLETFEHLLKGIDLHVVDVQKRQINGGSYRIILRRRKHPEYGACLAVLNWEQQYTSYDALTKFAWRVEQVRTQIQAVVSESLLRGPVDLYAASTKSSTLMQYCGFDATLIRQAVERTQEKVGRVTTGTRIPIVSEDTWRADPAPTTLLGAWSFAEAFCAREADYLQQGGVFVQPLPRPTLISWEGKGR